MKRWLLLLYSSVIFTGFFNQAEAQCPPTVLIESLFQTTVINGNTVSFCSGDSCRFTATPSSGVTYQWYRNNIIIPLGTNYIYYPTLSGDYYVIISSCTTQSATIHVDINPLPTGTVTANPPSPVCTGTLVTITLQTDFVNNSYDWSPPVPGNPSSFEIILYSTPNPAIHANVMNTTTLCSRTLPISIIVHPTINSGTIAADQIICYGFTPALLTGTLPSGGGGTYTYQWQSSIVSAVAGFSNITGATGQDYQPGPLTQTTWFRRITTSNSPCPSVSSNVVQITVNPIPTVTSAVTKSICSGTSVAYTPTSNVPGTTFNWTGVPTSPSVTVYGVSAIGNGTITDVLSIDPGGTASGEVTYTITPTGPGPTLCVGTPKDLVVTVKPLPVPVITGPTQTCFGSTGVIYATAAGMTGYVWTIQGGVITTGQNTYTITVNWTTPGPQWVRVTYTENGCAAASPTQYDVTVNPLPVPVITGPNLSCVGSAGNVYSTAAGMTNYIWTVSPGGTITGGGGTSSNTVTVTWNSAGSQWVRVTYTDANGCTNTSPTQYNVNVATPTLSGPTPTCLGSTSNVYSTEAGMTNYIWTVSPGGTITAGGTSTSSTATVTWNAAGTQIVTVNYTSSAGCTALTPTSLNVTVNPLPTPTITGNNDLCAETSGVVYTTQTGKSLYTWTISSGGTITSGGTSLSNTATVTWNSAGPRWIRVNYTDANGCTAVAPTQYDVTVKPLPTPGITGSTSECAGATGVAYSTEPGKTGYTWTISGGNITSPTNANSITVTWTTPGSRWVAVNYTDVNGCAAPNPTQYPVTVKPLPVPTIAGASSVCINASNVSYTTETGMTNYLWTVSGGGTVTGGGGTTDNSVYVTWNAMGPQTVSVNYTGTNGCMASSATNYAVTVNPLPTPTISGPNDVCANSTGNIYTTQPGMSDYLWSVSAGGTITEGGTTTSNTATITWNNSGPQSVTVNYSAIGCPAVSPTTYPVTANPLPTSNAGFDQLIPFGTSTTLTGTAGGGTPSLSYAWTPVASINGPNTTLTVLTTNIFVSPTDFTLTVNDSKGCVATDMVRVTLDGSALAVVATAAPQVICNNGASVQLNAVATGGNSQVSISYSWTSTPAGFTSTIQNPVVNPTQTTTYHVSVYDGFNTATNSVTVTVSPLPTIFTVTGGGEYCSGGAGLPVNLTGSQLGVNYQLLLNGAANGPPEPGSGSGFSFGNKTAPGTYTVRATNGTTSCQQMMTGSVVITVNPVPTAYAGSDQTIPHGVSTILTGSAGGGTPALNYLWTPTGLIASGETTLSPITQNIYATQTFTLTVTDSKGCNQDDQVDVIVNGNALSVTANVNSSTICEGDTAQLTATGDGGSGTYTYSWTSMPAGTPPWSSNEQNPTVTPMVNTQYTVTIDDGYNTATASVSVIVNPLPPAHSIDGGGAYCSGGAGVPVGLTGSDVGVNYQLYRNGITTGSTVPGTGSAISFGNQTVAGTYTARATRVATGCIRTMTGSTAITILPLPTAYSMTGGGSYPTGGIGVIVGITDTDTGIDYRLILNGTDTLTPAPGMAGNGSPMNFGYQTQAGDYTAIAINSSTGCVREMLGSVTVIINPYPELFNVFGGGPLCQGDTGVTVGLDGSEIGVRYVLRRGADSIGNFSGTGDTIFCGTFVTAGTYSVKGVNISTGLIKIMTGSATVVVNPLPTVFIVSSFGNFCPGTEVILNGSQLNTSYILLRDAIAVDTLAGTSSLLNFGPQTVAGTYTILASEDTTGCHTMMNGSVTVHPNPLTFTIYPPGISCAGDTVMLMGSESGILYQLKRDGVFNVGTPLTGTGSPLSFGPQTVAGTYTVLATNPVTSCAVLMLGSTTLHLLPGVYSVIPAGDTCAGVSIGLSGSQNYVKYVLRRDTVWVDTLTGTGLPIEFGVQTTPGIYTIVGFDSTTSMLCDNPMNGSTTIYPAPVIYTMSPGGYTCVGSGIGLNGSDTGVLYRLIKNGTQVILPEVPGTGNPISFGLQNFPGTYTVTAQNTLTGCISVMADSIVITDLPLQYQITPTGSHCTGTEIGVTGSQIGVNYMLLLNNALVATIPGTGSAISFGIQFQAGTYTVKGYNATPDSCQRLMAGSCLLMNNPLQFSITPAGLSCAGDTIYLSGSEPGIEYQLIRNGWQAIGLPKPGTGFQLNFGMQTLPGTYTITGTSVSTSCYAQMLGQAVLFDLPSVYALTPQGDTCENTVLHLSGSQTGVNYTLYRNAIFPVASIPGTGSTLSFGNQTTAGIYSVVASNGSPDFCSRLMQGTMTIHPLPQAYDFLPGGTVCQGATLSLNGSETGKRYSLYRNGILVAILDGTGSPLTFGSQSLPGTYTVIGQDTITDCWSTMSGTTVMVAIPTAYSLVPSGDTCENVPIGLNGSQAGVNYILKRNSIPVANTAGTGGSITFAAVITAGTYTVTAQNNTTDSCTSLMTGTLVIHASPVAYTITPAGVNCEPTVIGLDDSQTGVIYELIKNGIPTGITQTGTGSSLNFSSQNSGIYRIIGTLQSPPFCETLMTDSVVISPRPVVDAGANDSVCFPVASITVSATVANFSSLLWSSSGDGIFIDATSATTDYLIGINDKTNGSVILSVVANGTPECPGSSASDQLLLTIHPLPVAYAGNDIAICEGETFPASGSVQHAASFHWNTTGDGSFNDNTILDPDYTPGPLDILNGSVNLILTANGAFSCSGALDRDTMELTIHTLPTAHLTGSASICEGDTAWLTCTLTGTSPWMVQITNGTTMTTYDNIQFSPLIIGVFPAATTQYSITAVADMHCTGSAITGQPLIEVFPKPLQFNLFATNNGTYCQGGMGVEIGLDGSQTGVKYKMLKNGTPVVNAVAGTGDSISFGYLTAAGLYTAIAIDTTSPNLCSAGMIGLVTLTVHPIPVVDFHVDSTCLGQSSIFDIFGQDTAQVISWMWDFGDGTTAFFDFPAEPQHTYATVGVYQVTLVATDSTGCERTRIHPATVLSQPIVLFSATTPVCQHETVAFTDFSYSVPAISTYLVTWIWDYGDGDADTIYYPASQNTTHQYTSAGNFSVSLTVVNNIGCENQLSTNIHVLPRAISNYTYSSLCEDQLIQFTDISQTNGGGAIVTWRWNFGDPSSGTGNTSTLQNPTHNYASPGFYNTSLITTNVQGCSDTVVKNLQVALQAVADFHADTACHGSLTTFTDLSVPNAPSIVTYTWNFGDGTPTVSGLGPVQHLYALPGIYLANLQIVNSNGCVKDTTKSVLVVAQPTANFSSDAPQCIGAAVSFIDLSHTAHGYVAQWHWNFGDGYSVTVNYPNSPDVTHIYSSSGNYTVTLTIVTTDSCSATRTLLVIIQDTPVANFIFPNNNCSLTPVSFTDISQPNGGGPITQWLWDFGDPSSGVNNTSYLKNPTHLFSAGGNFDVVLIATNSLGCGDTITKQVTVEDNPVADFTADTACMGNATVFTDVSLPVSGTIVSWDWNFGDNTPHSNQQNPTHLYASPGNYNVHLTITASTGCIHDTLKIVPVSDIPDALFSFTNACVGTPTQFTDESTTLTGTITEWFWDFDDGNTSTEQNPQNTFATTGVFDVKLIATSSLGCSDSIVIPVTIHLGPTSGFTYHSFYCPAGQVNFSNQSSGNGSGIASYLWTFEPGFISTQANPTYVFSVLDTSYLVSLTVTDEFGCQDTFDSTIFIKPAFAFNIGADSVCVGSPTHFQAINLAPGDSLHFVRWNFGEPSSGFSNTSTLHNPEHTYASSDFFMVKLTAWNSENCMDSLYREIVVHSSPEVAFKGTSISCDSNVYFTDQTVIPAADVGSWTWDFGDGTPANTIYPPNSPDITHVFPQMGVFYMVTLTVTSSYGCIDSLTQSVQRYPCISAGISLGDTLICNQQEAIFLDQSAPADLISNWEWHFGDGTDTSYVNRSDSVMHLYATNGTYDVMLIVTINSLGVILTDTTFYQTTIKPRPAPGFIASATCLADTSRFLNTSASFPADSLQFLWSFGDPLSGTANTSNLENPVHYYDNPGLYEVSLLSLSSNGCYDSLMKPLRISSLPTAVFTSSYECVNHPAMFMDSSMIGDTVIVSWYWNFGVSGTLSDTSILENPTYTYDSVTSHQVFLKITDASGCQDTTSKIISVKPSPISEFTIRENYEGIQGQILLQNQSSGASFYLWDFGNGETSEEEEPVVAYTKDGTYIIWLVTYNNQTCYDSAFLEYELLFRGLFVPNAFAPTTLVNEVRLFKPVGINLKEYQITVFDTWGHVLWESSALDKYGSPIEGWNGTYKNELMPQGTYMWKISATFEDGSVWQGSDNGKGKGKTIGTVTLIR